MTDLASIDDDLRGAGPHRPRPIRFVRLEQVGDWQLKLYTIARHGETPRPELVAEALRRAPEVFPRDARGDGRHGVGFMIVHDASYAIALYYWWQSFNELHQRVLAGPEPGALRQLEHATAGCVWELEVIDFERRAWLTDMLAHRDGPSVARYLARHTNTDV